jgi:hypothetical protein
MYFEQFLIIKSHSVVSSVLFYSGALLWNRYEVNNLDKVM